MKLKTLLNKYDHSLDIHGYAIELDDYTTINLLPIMHDFDGYDMELDDDTILDTEIVNLTITLFNYNKSLEQIFVWPTFEDIEKQLSLWLED